MDEEGASGADNIVTEFATYEDFLDSQITSLDLYYLEVSVCIFCRSVESYYCFCFIAKILYFIVAKVLNKFSGCSVAASESAFFFFKSPDTILNRIDITIVTICLELSKISLGKS